MRGNLQALLAIPVFTIAALILAAKPVNQAHGSTSPIGQASPEAARAPGQLNIILLKPEIRFENIRGGMSQDWSGMTTPTANKKEPAYAVKEDYEHLLLSAARLGVGSKANAFDSDTLGLSVAEACTKLQPLASRLARGNVNEEAVNELASLATLDKHYAVLAQFLRLETGPGRAWNPTTGAIASSTDSTLIQAALVSGETGRIIWKSERLIRNKTLKPTDAALSKALTDMYRDFDIK
jgi:hypothetical protein